MADTAPGGSSIVGHPGRRWRDRLSALLEEEAADAPPMEDDPFPAAAAQKRELRGKLLAVVRVRAKEEAKLERVALARRRAEMARASTAAADDAAARARTAAARKGPPADAWVSADAAAARAAAAALAVVRIAVGPPEPQAPARMSKPRPIVAPSDDPEVLAKAAAERERLAKLSCEELADLLRKQRADRKARRLKPVEEGHARARAREQKAKARAKARVVSKRVRVATAEILSAIKAVGSAKVAKRRARRAGLVAAHRSAAAAVREARRALAEAKAWKAAANARLVRKTGFPGLPEPEDMFPTPVDGPIRDAAWLAQQQEEFYTLNLKRMEEERRQYLKDMRKADKERHVKTVIRKLYGRLRKALTLKIHHLNKALAAAESEEARAAVQAEIDRAGAAMQVPEEEILATLAEAEASVRAFIGKGEVVVKASAVSLATENSGFSKARRRKAPRDPHARRAAQAGKPKVPRIPRGQKEAEQIATPRDLKEPPITAAAAGLLDDLLK